ncbi:MAG TPA: high-potential iron-sulfur protein [Tahibacter sp.]|nr:high-potential iron-sulfur protein [Tahibacter sp.]
MSRNSHDHERRRFVATLTAAALIGAVVPRRPRAADLPHLPETDPTAQALGYHEDAAKTDTAKFPAHQASQRCANCNFFAGGGDYGACQLFPGKAVNANGWCSAYAAKPA